MIRVDETVNMKMKGARRKISAIASKFKAECTQLCVSPRAWRQGGRMLRREIERKGLDVKVNESGNTIILAYTKKKKHVGYCVITRLNWDPESSIMNPKHPAP